LSPALYTRNSYNSEVLDDCLIAVDEFHHVSANPDNKLGDHIRKLMTHDKTHIVAMTGSYFRGDAEAVCISRTNPNSTPLLTPTADWAQWV
jgi:superfamily II DNA or RNA helicase